jgi:hypothetical protein
MSFPCYEITTAYTNNIFGPCVFILNYQDQKILILALLDPFLEIFPQWHLLSETNRLSARANAWHISTLA